MASGKYSDIYMLIVHELIQSAAAYLHEQDAKKITISSIADILKTKDFSLNEEVIRDCLQNDFSHLISFYGISIRTHYEINQGYKRAIISLWERNRCKPTFAELARELRVAPNAVLEKIGRGGWLKKLWEEGPKADTGSGTKNGQPLSS